MSVAKKIINDFIDDDRELNKLELSKLTKEELISFSIILKFVLLYYHIL